MHENSFPNRKLFSLEKPQKKTDAPPTLLPATIPRLRCGIQNKKTHKLSFLVSLCINIQSTEQEQEQIPS